MYTHLSDHKSYKFLKGSFRIEFKDQDPPLFWNVNSFRKQETPEGWLLLGWLCSQAARPKDNKIMHETGTKIKTNNAH